MWYIWLTLVVFLAVAVTVSGIVAATIHRRKRAHELQALINDATSQALETVDLQWTKTCPCICVVYNGSMQEFVNSVTAAHMSNPLLTVEGWLPASPDDKSAKTLAALHRRPGCFIRTLKHTPDTLDEEIARGLAWAVLEETRHREILLVSGGTNVSREVSGMFSCNEYLHNRFIAWLNGDINRVRSGIASWSSDLLMVDRYHVGKVSAVVKHMCRRNSTLVYSAWPRSFDEWRTACEESGTRFYEVPFFSVDNNDQVSHFAPFVGLDPDREAIALRVPKRT